MIKRLQKYKGKTIKVHLEENWNFLGAVCDIDAEAGTVLMNTDTTEIVIAIDQIKAITFVESYARGPKCNRRPQKRSPYDPLIGRDYARR